MKIGEIMGFFEVLIWELMKSVSKIIEIMRKLILNLIKI